MAQDVILSVSELEGAVYVDAVVDLPAPVKAFLDRPEHKLLIGGGWRSSLSGKTLDVIDPATGRTIAVVPDANEEDIDEAVIAARAALDGEWSRLLPADRTDRMLALANLIAEHSETIAHLEALEQGKLIEFARVIEVDMAVDYVRYMAGWATKIEGSTIDLSVRMVEGPKYHAFTRQEPVGVVAGIVPWNFPHLMAIWKIAPALATGCTIVLKPAEETPLTALFLGELICEAGFPDGVVNIVTGFGESAGAALVRHPGIDKIAFTGSTAVGKQIGVEAMKNMTRVSLELGGKSPVLVLDDIGTDFIAPGMIGGLFFNSGQQCVA
ncbi:MAG: aldehyde dehydrogenase family protein, partial [Actinomycetota bacterium]|nr:aldehyde dehydrogenase family protein [Actinomycetota bacterium]